MKYFLITNHSFRNLKVTNSINVFERDDDKYWYSTFETDDFLVKTYDFDELIFVIRESEVHLLEPYTHVQKIKRIFIKKPFNLRRTLKKLDADKNLMNKVYVL